MRRNERRGGHWAVRGGMGSFSKQITAIPTAVAKNGVKKSVHCFEAIHAGW